MNPESKMVTEEKWTKEDVKRTKKDIIDFYDQQAKDYTKTYYGQVTPNSVRLDLFMRRFQALQCKIVDAGCGSGIPTLTFLQHGMDARGFDFSSEMVKESKKTLKEHGFNEDYIVECDLENTIPFNDMRFDGMMMHGPLMHATDEKQLLRNACQMLKSGGIIMCEARNELMSAFSMNEYSARFYKELIGFDSLPEDIKETVEMFYEKLTGFNISAPWVAPYKTKFHNPLTIQKLFEECGFEFVRLHFSHFHALPPIFKKRYPEFFEARSLEMEDSDDWRGYLMASTFLVEAVKK